VRFKRDENLSVGLAEALTEAGHDAATVRGEGMSGWADRDLYQACRAEQRALVTLDMDFANPLRFPPEGTAGIIVLRPARPLLRLLRVSLGQALRGIEAESVAGRLWIVEPGGLRVYEPSPESADEEGWQ